MQDIAVNLVVAPQGKDFAKTNIKLVTDMVVKTILNNKDWDKVGKGLKLPLSDKIFHPYGTQQILPIRGMAEVTHKAKAGATTKTLVYVKNSNTEDTLLGKMDARRLGIIEVQVEGRSEEVQVPWVKQTKCMK